MTAEAPPNRIVLLIGAGGMGLAVAEQLAVNKNIILADFSPKILDSAIETLKASGLAAESYKIDITNYEAVKDLAAYAASKGRIDAIINTAGLAPTGPSAKSIYEVDLLGTAHIIEAFQSVVSQGTALVCIASMSAYFVTLSPELERHFATAKVSDLLKHSEIDVDGEAPEVAYTKSKRANILRVQAAAKAWGSKGARLNTISPGVIATPILLSSSESVAGKGAKAMVGISALGRMGSPAELANVAVFLASSESSYITGNDILVDGGTVASKKWM